MKGSINRFPSRNSLQAKSKRLFFLPAATILSVIAFTSPTYASSDDPYESGYNHGCDDAGLADVNSRYINQPEKGPSFHTKSFMDGYNDGFGSCSNSSSMNGTPNKSDGEPPLLFSNDFNPDESCLFDVTQPKCIPGEEQDCPKTFGTNEDGQCFPLNAEGVWECPEGYHSIDDDESGQCYPNDDGCPGGMVLREDQQSCIDVDACEDSPNSRDCIDKETHCKLYPNSDYCKGNEDKCQNHLTGSRCIN
jgi:hypothetical protein